MRPWYFRETEQKTNEGIFAQIAQGMFSRSKTCFVHLLHVYRNPGGGCRSTYQKLLNSLNSSRSPPPEIGRS